MAQRKPEEQITLEQVLKLVEKLSPDDQEQLRIRLDRNTRQQEWRNLGLLVSDTFQAFYFRGNLCAPNVVRAA